MRLTGCLGGGQEVALVAKQLEVSEQTLHRWRVQYGGLLAFKIHFGDRPPE